MQLRFLSLALGCLLPVFAFAPTAPRPVDGGRGYRAGGKWWYPRRVARGTAAVMTARQPGD